MCALYGLGGGASRLLEEKERGLLLTFVEDLAQSEAELAEWMHLQGGRARITGARTRNLNPLIHELHGARKLEFGWWWLFTGDAPASYRAFNSRDDKLTRSWRAPFQRRALLPATWYTEKRRDFGLNGGDLFAIAAIVTPVAQPDGSVLLSYSMVTRTAVGEAASVHDRMPLVLPAGIYDEWLAPGRPGDASLVTDALLASDEISRGLTVLGPRPLEPDQPIAPTLF